MMATLSLCMIVKDESRFLSKCLDSVKEIADEMIIVDTGSTDNTKEIAQKAGAKVFDINWKDDFSAARNFSLSKATSNWVLVLDADEQLDKSACQEIIKLINTKEHCFTDIIGFKLEQLTIDPTAGVPEGGHTKGLSAPSLVAERSSLVRLFKNNPKIRFANKVHELVENSIKDNNGTIIDTNIPIIHYGLFKKDKLHAKQENYTDLMWKQLEQEPENPRYNRQVAVAFHEKKQLNKALKYFMRTLKFDTEFPGIFRDLGKLYIDMNRPKQAIKVFNMAIAKDKTDVSSLNNLAVIYMNFGKTEISRKLLDKALQLEPDNPAAASNLDKLKRLDR